MSKRNSKFFLRTSVSLGVVAALTGTPMQLAAQELEEIIVTARKRVQNIQDVPVPIQAFDTNSIREKGLRDFEDYQKELTSVSFGTSSPGATTIAFRGTLAQPTGFDDISSSTLYLDEIPITRDGQNADVRLIDIERIEALSGPQPTLYGAGSQSGTLKIVTNKPNTSEYSGFVDVGLSSTREGDGSYDVSAAFNIPIVEEKLAVRLVGFFEEEGGYIDNVLGTTGDYSPNSGTRDNAAFVEEDINDYKGRGARLLLRWRPNEKWTIDTGIVYQNSELGSLFDFNPAFGDLNTIKFKDENRDDEWYNFALTVQGDLGFADLTIATGFHDREIDYNIDATAYMTSYRDNGLAIAEYYTGTAAFLDYDTCYATAYCYLFVNYNDFGPDPTATISLDQRVKSYATEVRLTSKDDGESRFNWLIGVFHEDTNNDWDYITIVDDFAENGGGGSIFTYYGVAPSDVWFDQGFRDGFTYNGLAGNDFNGQIQDIDSFAIFGEVSFELTEALTFSAGGRWFSIDRRVNENSFFVSDSPFDNFDVTETTEDFSPRFNVSWKPTEDFLGYITYSEGVRPGGRNGGVNQRPASIALGAPEAFDADKLKNTELGVKATWMEGRLLTNMSLFNMDWEDYQIRASLPIAGATTVNAGNATIDGVEGQFAFAATEKLELSAAFTYLDASVDDDIIIGNGTITAGNAGDPLPAVPEWKVAAGALFTTPLAWGDGGLEGYMRYDFSFVGDSVNGTNASVSLFGAGSTVPQRQPSYTISDFSIGVRSESGWETWLSINNVWDERAITYIWPRFSDNRVFTVRPREIRLGFYKSF
ncbi:MAG: TonB-dependent receptor [Pseudomonadota bacterium]